MRNPLCWLKGHTPVQKESETAFVTFNDGERFWSRFQWTECARCGRRLTTATVETIPATEQFIGKGPSP